MQRKFLIGLLLCSFLSVKAQFTQQQFDIKLSTKDNTVNNKASDIAEIRVFLPDSVTSKGRAILACPGGAYMGLAIEHEGYDWAQFFNKKGIAYIVLKYRLPKGNKEIPFNDGIEAMRIIRENAKKWHINPNDIGIMGSSAGGHLASTIATKAPWKMRPNFQILFYPVITMNPRFTHHGSMYSLLGKNATKETIDAYSNEKNVLRHLTPPAILLLSHDDLVVSPENSIAYYKSLLNNDVPASMHIYPTGNHGWGFKSSFKYHNQMLNDLSCWLNNLPSYNKNAIKVACVGNSITDGMGIPMSEIYGYPSVLSRMLGSNYIVQNFGVSARTMLSKGDFPYIKEKAYKECKDFNPDIVILKLGTNDSKKHNWKFKDEFEKDMQNMINELSSLPSSPQIILSYPAKMFNNNCELSDSIIYNEIIPIISKVAKKNKLSIIDFYSLFNGKPELMQQDGIHPNINGAKAMAIEVKKHIEAIDKRKQ